MPDNPPDTPGTAPDVPDVPDVLHTYLAMWNDADLSQTRSYIDLAVAEHCVWTDPQHQHVGRDALEANVHGFRGRFPTAELLLGSNVDSHNNRHRYEWYIINRGRLMIRGFDVTTVDAAGLIERVDGFFGTLERTGPEKR